MTHFLFLEKGAQRDAQRAQREKTSRDGASPRTRRHEEASTAAAPAFLFLMVPSASGYRVMRAALEEIGEIASSELGRLDASQGPELLLERLLAGNGASALGRAEPEAGYPGSVLSRGATRPARESFGDVEIDVPARVVTRAGEVVALAPMEFDLLLALVRRNGAAATRRELLREVWGTTKAVSLRTVDTHVSNLRRKLEADASHPSHVLTVKKVGYRLKR